MPESTEIVRERELTFKTITKENLVLFVVPKLYIKNKSIKDELCKKIHNSSSFFFTQK